MKHLALPLTLALVLVASLALAQTPDGQQNDPTKTQTVTGCLTKGDQPNEFFVVQSGNKKAEVTATEDLSAHAGKQVKITGANETVQGRNVFKATKIEVVAPTCTSGS